MKYVEVNFDGLVGPSHNYAGLSLGNLASKKNAKAISNPKEAALQGLDKMQTLVNLGMVQGIIPPLARPNLKLLDTLGFEGSIQQQLEKAYKLAPTILAACYSASNMWVANAATVTSSLDANDNKIHFTAANLLSQFHRSTETNDTAELLKLIFNDPVYFKHHPPLPHHSLFSDEGAANHTRLCPHYAHTGINLFVYGESNATLTHQKPKKYPARQTLEASQAIARSHQLKPEQTIFIQQNPAVIDQGVFHNDVIAVGNLNVLLFHEHAFANADIVREEIQQKWHALTSTPLHLINISAAEISVKEAIQSYIFNTQLVQLPNKDIALIAPAECQNIPRIQQYLLKLTSNHALYANKQRDSVINSIIYQDVKQSMKNGGGPACLRLRVNMNEAELAAVNPNFILDDTKIEHLKNIVNTHYPEALTLADLSSQATFNQINKANQALALFFDLPAQ